HQSILAGPAGRRIRPRLRRQERRLVQSAPRERRYAACRDRRLQLDRGTLRQRGTDRLQRGQRSALQADVKPAPDESRDPRTRHRLDGVEWYRNGEPWLDPEDDGGGGHRHAHDAGGDYRGPPRAWRGESR